MKLQLNTGIKGLPKPNFREKRFSKALIKPVCYISIPKLHHYLVKMRQFQNCFRQLSNEHTAQPPVPLFDNNNNDNDDR